MDSNYGIRAHIRAIKSKWKVVNSKDKIKLLLKILLRTFGIKKCLFLGGYYQEESIQQAEEDEQIYIRLKKQRIRGIQKTNTPMIVPKQVSNDTTDVRGNKKGLLETGDSYIALVSESLDKGGLEEVVYMLALALKERKLGVKVFCIQSGGNVAKRLSEQGIEVLVFQRDRDKLRKYCRENTPLLVNTHFVSDVLDVFGELEIPIIEVIHNTYAFLDTNGWNKEKEKSKYIRKYIAVSENAKRMFCSHCSGVSEEKVIVIGNAPNNLKEITVTRAETRRALGISKDAFVYVMVGSIDARKNQVGILRAWSIFQRLVEDDIVLWIVGSGSDYEYEAYVDRVMEERALREKVIFVGESDCVHELLNASDVFIMNSYYEGWSVAATEALFYGVPIIHSDCGSGRELTAGGRNGIFVANPLSEIEEYDSISLYDVMHAGKDENVEEVVGAMLEMYENRDDWKVKREEISQYVKETFSFETMINSYLQVYSEVLD